MKHSSPHYLLHGVFVSPLYPHLRGHASVQRRALYRRTYDHLGWVLWILVLCLLCECEWWWALSRKKIVLPLNSSHTLFQVIGNFGMLLFGDAYYVKLFPEGKRINQVNASVMSSCASMCCVL